MDDTRETTSKKLSRAALTSVLMLSMVLMAAVGSLLNAGASPLEQGPSPTITSDYGDYPPGATVNLTGAGWQMGEAVHIFVNDDASQSWSLNADVTADAGGGFTYSFQLPNWFVANYTVTATGAVSGVASTSFTDMAIGAYDQCSNDDGDGYATGDTGCRWVFGNLQSNNSTYFEGDATVQRVWLTDFVPGTTHTLTLKYGTTKGGKHAYDFLTTWDWSEDWITDADRCQDITGCLTATPESTLAIPVDPNAGGFDAAIADRHFVMRGGTLTSATTPAIVSGDYTGDSETVITITFTVASSGDMCVTQNNSTTCAVAIWFGAHIATQANWGLGQGAGGIPGSPYHVALDAVDGAAVGQRDNQMQSDTVISTPTPTPTPTDTPTNTPTPTDTPTNTPTNTPTDTPTNTPTNTPTDTPTPTPTDTPTNTPTNTPTDTPTPTPTDTPTNTPTNTPTDTPTPTPTDTPTNTPTFTPTNTPTNTPTPTPSIGAFTPGYWKNHLADSVNGHTWSSPYCKTVSKYGGSCSTNGPWAIQYLPQLLGNYQVDTIIKAAQVFKSMNCGSSKPNDAVGCLAGHLLATKLNLANGSLACPSILQAVADADAFLSGQTVNGVPGINYVGPGGSYTLTAAQRSLVISLKTKLDQYNNNISCP